MLRFPVRLTADLAKARFAPGVRPVRFVDAAELLHHGAGHPVSHEKIRELSSSRSPVVWMGGSEPLEHPGVSHLVRTLTQTGHFVFLETDGMLLRRRIHEFQPVPRLFLTVRLLLGVPRNDSDRIRAGAFDLAVEGIRAARLSGFFVCVSTRVAADTELAEASELIQLAQSLDADGIVVTSANDGGYPAKPDSLTLKKTEKARRLIGGNWWEWFSQLVEPVLRGISQSSRNGQETNSPAHEEADTNEEGARVA